MEFYEWVILHFGGAIDKQDMAPTEQHYATIPKVSTLTA